MFIFLISSTLLLAIGDSEHAEEDVDDVDEEHQRPHDDLVRLDVTSLSQDDRLECFSYYSKHGYPGIDGQAGHVDDGEDAAEENIPPGDRVAEKPNAGCCGRVEKAGQDASEADETASEAFVQLF